MAASGAEAVRASAAVGAGGGDGGAGAAGAIGSLGGSGAMAAKVGALASSWQGRSPSLQQLFASINCRVLWRETTSFASAQYRLWML